MSNSKGWLQLGLTQYLDKDQQLCREVIKKGFRLPGVANHEKVVVWGKLVRDKACFSKIGYVDPSGGFSGLTRVQSCLL